MARVPRIPALDDVRRLDRAFGDIGVKIDKIAQFSEKWSDAFKNTVAAHRDLQKETSSLEKNMRSLQDTIDRLSHVSFKDLDKEEKKLVKTYGDKTKAVKNLTKDLGELVKKMVELKKETKELDGKMSAFFKTLASKGFTIFDRLMKGIISTTFSLFTKGLRSIYDGIYKVYELQERWTKLLGTFRTRLGVATRDISVFTKIAAQVEGVMYGLTGAFGQGAPMVNEFMESLGRVEDIVKGKNIAQLIKEGTLMSRVLGISAGESGALTRSLQQMGESLTGQRKLFKDIVVQARAAGVSTSKYGKAVVEARDFMASFGRVGRQAFLNVLTYAQKLGVSMKSMQAFTDITDSFESAVKMASRINRLAGTSLSGLQLLLERDPSKRLEMVRSQLLRQGKTFENLSRIERKIIGDSFKLSHEELAGVLRDGKKLTDIRKDQENAAKQQAKAQKNLARLINSTSTTLFSFGQAWDKVTRAIARLLKPFTDMLGLTGKAKTFGGVMSNVFKKLVAFMDRIAQNPHWKAFIGKLAGDFLQLARGADRLASGPGLVKWIKNVVGYFDMFYEGLKKVGSTLVSIGVKLAPALEFVMKHFDKLFALWLGAKGVALITRLREFAMFSAAGGAAGAAGGAGGLLGGLGRLQTAGGFALAGGAIGSIFGAGTGGAIGGAIGGLISPIGGAIGALLGGAVQKIVGGLKTLGKSIEEFDREKFKKWIKSGKKTIKDEEKFRNLSSVLEIERRKRFAKEEQTALELVKKSRKSKIILDEKEQLEFAKHIDGLQMLGKSTDKFDDILYKMSESNGPLKLTSREMKILYEAVKKHHSALNELTTKINVDLSMALEDISGKKEKFKRFKEIRKEGVAADIKKALTMKKISEHTVRVLMEEANNLKTSGIRRKEINAKVKLEIAKRDAFTKKIRKLKATLQNLDEEYAQAELRWITRRAKIQKMRFILESYPEINKKYSNFKSPLKSVFDKMGSFFRQESIQKFAKERGVPESIMKDVATFASGGIVTAPTRSMIGEAGPEAVIPLTGSPAKVYAEMPADARAAIVNFAKAAGASDGGGGPMTLVAGDVYLDGRLVGRHMVRALLEGEYAS